MPQTNSFQNRNLRGALLGTGSISQHHMLAWSQIPGVEIVAIANRTRGKALALGLQFDVAPEHIYADYRELLEKEQIDFVDIATAPHIHSEQVQAAAALGVHVFCQKPFATSMTEARRMIAACDAANLRCIVNENWRWRPHYRDLKQQLTDSIIGPVRYARFCYHGDEVLPLPDGSTPPLLVRQPLVSKMPRMILLEWGIHLVDVLRFLFGEPLSVFAQLARRSPLVKGEDTAVLQLGFAGGMIGIVDISWSSVIAPERRLCRGQLDPLLVEGESGTIVLDPFHGNPWQTIRSTGEVLCNPTEQCGNPAEVYQQSYYNTQTHFVERMKSNQPAENEAADNLKTLAIVMAAYESSEKKAVVRLEKKGSLPESVG